MGNTRSSPMLECMGQTMRGWSLCAILAIRVVQVVQGGLMQELEQWVRSWIRTAPNGAKLPYDRELAESFGVSAMTIRRTLSRLAAEGVVERIKGKGTFAPRHTAPEPQAEPNSAADAGESLVAHLRSAIGRGELKRGDAVPPYKVLCTTFQVSPNTVSRALRRLAAEELVVRVGKYHRVGRFLDNARLPVRKDVFFFADETVDISAIFSTHEAALAFNKMERELVAHGHRLRFARTGTIDSHVRAWIERRRFPQGIILTGANYQAVVNHGDFQRAAGPLEHLRRRAGSLCPTQMVITTVYQPPSRSVVPFSISHAVVMMRRRLARFLFEKGYQQADYYFEESPENLFLLMDAMRMVPEIDRLNRAFRLRYIVKPRDPDESRSHFLRRYLSIYPQRHLEPRLSKYRTMTLDEVLANLVVTGDLDSHYDAPDRAPVWLFEQEQRAVRALDWCADKGLRVPADIAIVGLENDRRFAERGITACVRDWETMGYLMAHVLIGDIPIQKTHRGFVAYDALLLERQTTPS
ncbi:MAG: GntR family transcriptional regulator [Chitinivibrionales bacterium]|nr:GntR family transcriptional regulator [Chitinivibrionales bacterium]